jgi:hypothetical protein
MVAETKRAARDQVLLIAIAVNAGAVATPIRSVRVMDAFKGYPRASSLD